MVPPVTVGIHDSRTVVIIIDSISVTTNSREDRDDDRHDDDGER